MVVLAGALSAVTGTGSELLRSGFDASQPTRLRVDGGFRRLPVFSAAIPSRAAPLEVRNQRNPRSGGCGSRRDVPASEVRGRRGEGRQGRQPYPSADRAPPDGVGNAVLRFCRTWVLISPWLERMFEEIEQPCWPAGAVVSRLGSRRAAPRSVAPVARAFAGPGSRQGRTVVRRPRPPGGGRRTRRQGPAGCGVGKLHARPARPTAAAPSSAADRFDPARRMRNTRGERPW